VQVWAYCLMPNHVHLVLVPKFQDGLHLSLAETHRRYTRFINHREKWKGYLWQGRFSSFPMDETHLYAAVKYVELNPVKANLCGRAEDWKWSSARAHLAGRNDQLIAVEPMLARVSNWSKYLDDGCSEDAGKQLRRHERTGRPLGSDDFLNQLEALSGRILRPQKPGPKKES